MSAALSRVLGPVGPEVSCGRCFELLDQYVDLEVAGADADAVLPGMRAHLEGCSACHEDHESLRELFAGTSDPRPRRSRSLLSVLGSRSGAEARARLTLPRGGHRECCPAHPSRATEKILCGSWFDGRGPWADLGAVVRSARSLTT